MSFKINERDLDLVEPGLSADQAQRVVGYLVAGGWDAEYSETPSDDLTNEFASDGWLRPAVEHYAYTVTLPTLKFDDQKFELGAVTFTPGVLDAAERAYKVPAMFAQLALQAFIQRHALGDWGDVDDQDGHRNDLALKQRERIFSVYHLPQTNAKIYVITERDRSATTVLLPSEY